MARLVPATRCGARARSRPLLVRSAGAPRERSSHCASRVRLAEPPRDGGRLAARLAGFPRPGAEPGPPTGAMGPSGVPTAVTRRLRTPAPGSDPRTPLTTDTGRTRATR